MLNTVKNLKEAVVRRKANNFFDQGKYELAIKSYTEIIKLNKNPVDYYNRGMAYYFLKDYDSAIYDFSEAKECDNKEIQADAYFWRGIAYYSKEGRCFIDDFTRAIKLREKENADDYMWRGKIYYSCNKYKLAIQDAEKALEINPDLNGSIDYLASARAIVAEMDSNKKLYHDEKAIQIMTDFVEGKMDIKSFKNEFDNNAIIKKTLGYDPLFMGYSGFEGKDIIRYLERRNLLRRGDQLGFWGGIEDFLSRCNYPFTPTQYYDERYGFLLNVQPSWVIIEDDFLEEQIVSKIPDDLLTKAKRIAWCKAQIKELFRCDKSKPRWIQDVCWPILNGKPLVFKKQIKNTSGHNDGADFIFYNPDTGEEHIITQWY
jgi:tetratricopeptide (TPR) repeat protein